MAYLLKLQAADGLAHVLLTLDEAQVRPAAIDVFFDLLGRADPAALVASKTLPEHQREAFEHLRQALFDRDEQGLFVREGVTILAGAQELDPDQPLITSFVAAEKEGMRYFRLELTVRAAGAPAAGPASAVGDRQAEMRPYARMLFLHQTGIGHGLDVTRDYPDLEELVGGCEREGLIAVDVPTATYKLSAKGQRLHRDWLDDAQDLIRRFDVFGDVELDSSGRAHFDTGLGEDWRVPVYELQGVDPFKARFLLGLNDGEWDALEDWRERLFDPDWYAEIFAPIERAPGVDELGRDRLQRVIDQARDLLTRQRP